MRDPELCWTVALEAALFFSMPSWWLMAEAWPANGPIRFALTILVGGTVAAVLFHVIPALCSPAKDPAIPVPSSRNRQRARLWLQCRGWAVFIIATVGAELA
jgi:hypothetical protein